VVIRSLASLSRARARGMGRWAIFLGRNGVHAMSANTNHGSLLPSLHRVGQEIATSPSCFPVETDVLALLRQVQDEAHAISVSLEPAATQNLMLAIVEAVGSLIFTSAELVRHAELAPSLRAAILQSVGRLSARRLGKLLHRLEGVAFEGFMIERVLGRDREGALWVVRIPN
jgi:hypothetical protein